MDIEYTARVEPLELLLDLAPDDIFGIIFKSTIWVICTVIVIETFLWAGAGCENCVTRSYRRWRIRCDVMPLHNDGKLKLEMDVVKTTEVGKRENSVGILETTQCIEYEIKGLGAVVVMVKDEFLESMGGSGRGCL